MMFGVMGVLANLSQHEIGTFFSVLFFDCVCQWVTNKLWTCEMIWNCLAIDHGKGEVDGVGTLLI